MIRLYRKTDGKVELLLETNNWGQLFRHKAIYERIAIDENGPMPFLIMD
jgi:hypothetical protein